jgi:predicted nucleic acid-binding protein
MKAFVDSNVFISAIQDEFGGGWEFMSERVEEFFDRVMSCMHTIVLSRGVIKEITDKTFFTSEEIKQEYAEFWDKIKFVEPSLDDMDNADRINKKYRNGSMDSLFLVIAEKEGCDCIVTWNKKDFEITNPKIKILKPDEL